MRWEDFNRWFNRDFWRAFRRRTFPIRIPQSQAEKNEKVRSVFEAIRSARYAPSIPEAEIVINKGSGIARTVPVFCIDDYLVYYFCIKELEPIIAGNRTEHTFGGWTLGGQLRRAEELDMEFDIGFSGARYAFDPRSWTRAFGEFNSLLFAQIETGAFTHVLQFDLSNFYDCIRLDILERSIREDAPAEKGWIIALLFYFLNQWNRRNTGLHPQGVGIPQDALADCSRILANYYLQRYDHFAEAICRRASATYFRYADDQMILLRDTSQIDELMLLLTRFLDRHGLRVNQKKVELWTGSALQRHRCRGIQALFAAPGSNRDSHAVRQFVDRYLRIHANRLSRTWNSGLPLLNRLLWANIESLPRNLFERIMVRFTSAGYLVRAEKDKLVRIDQLNQTRRNPIDFRRRIRALGERLVHSAFHYECLGFAIEVRDRGLTRFFRQRLEQINANMEANRLSS